MFGLGAVNSGRANASPIHHAEKVAMEHAGTNRTWSEYLLGGPSVWSTIAHPQLNATIESAMWKSIKHDPPPNPSAVVQFFLYKQSLDPARFDHYHPRVAVALAKIKTELVSAAATPTPTSTTTTSSPTDQAQTLGPPASSPDVNSVPEPGTLLLSLGMVGYALWWRRRHD
jgi:hypothetical protein